MRANPKSHILYHVQNVTNELTRTDLEKKLIETDKLSAKKKTLKKNTVKAWKNPPDGGGLIQLLLQQF